MEIINEKIEVLGEVRLGSGVVMKYCHIRYKEDNDSRYPVIIIEQGDSLNRTTETMFVVEKDFKEFVKNIYLKLDDIEVVEKEGKLFKIKDGIFSKKGLDY